MIKSLKLINFKSHQQSYLKFSPGVNVIIGDPQSGKSNLLRALLWIATNRPSTGNLVTNSSSGKVRVEVTLDKDTSISLDKKIKDRKTKNQLYTVTKNGKQHEFKAFGRGVPEAVSQNLNLSELNFQKQLSKPFLLQESSGNIGRYINHITNLEIADELISILNRKSLSQKRKADLLDQEIKDLNLRLETYKGIDRLGELVEEIEDKQQEIDICRELKQDISEKHQKYKKLSRQIAEINRRLGARESVYTALKMLHEKEHFIAIRQNALSLKEATEDIKSAKQSLDNLDVLLAGASSDLQDLKEYEQLKSKLILFKALETDKMNTIKDLSNSRTSYIELMRKAKSCPMCGTSIDKNTIKRLEIEI